VLERNRCIKAHVQTIGAVGSDIPVEYIEE
jgi:hypothetical protein